MQVTHVTDKKDAVYQKWPINNDYIQFQNTVSKNAYLH